MLQQSEETLEDKTTGLSSTARGGNNMKRPRESESAGTETGTEPHNKKNLMAETSQAKPPSGDRPSDSGADSSSDMDTHEPHDNPSEEDNTMNKKGTNTESKDPNKVNQSSSVSPPMGPAQWEQIMARFDSFEKTVQATIKEEIKVNSIGLQKQVKTLTGKVKVVENHILANTNEIAKINQKINNFDNIQEFIASEVQKQVSEKVANMEKDLEISQAEIAKLKNASPKAHRKESDPSDTVSRQEFMKEQCLSRKRNLMMMGVEEAKEGEEDEKSKISELLEKRLGIPKTQA